MFEGNQLCSSPAEYIPKVKHAVSSLMLWAVFQQQRLRDSMKSSMHQNIEIALMKTKSRLQSIQNLRLGRRFTLQQDNDPNHTARVAYTQRCECLWVAQPQPGLEPNQIFLKKPENMRLPPTSPNELWKSLRGEEVRRQMWMSKAFRIKQKRLEAVKVLQLNI